MRAACSCKYKVKLEQEMASTKVFSTPGPKEESSASGEVRSRSERIYPSAWAWGDNFAAGEDHWMADQLSAKFWRTE